jgi:peptidoglycan biosynthesis protein MviN/MurJ (putative lipid II flippase)
MPLGGLALANSLATVLETLILTWLIRARLGGLGGRALWASAWRIGIGAGIMCAALFGYLHLVPSGSPWVAVVGVVVGAGAFVSCTALLRSPELIGVLSAARAAARRRLER